MGPSVQQRDKAVCASRPKMRCSSRLEILSALAACLRLVVCTSTRTGDEGCGGNTLSAEGSCWDSRFRSSRIGFEYVEHLEHFLARVLPFHSALPHPRSHVFRRHRTQLVDTIRPWTRAMKTYHIGSALTNCRLPSGSPPRLFKYSRSKTHFLIRKRGGLCATTVVPPWSLTLSMRS